MSTKLKLYIANKVHRSLGKQPLITPATLINLVKVGCLQNGKFPNVCLALDVLQKHVGISNCNNILAIKPDNIISRIYLENDRANRIISFDIDRNIFIKDVLENITVPNSLAEPKNIVVEYSSPNIAKPFHLGHLRSTIIGNFVANLSKHLGNSITRINYLGDWGTQFGMLKIGVDLSNLTKEQIKADPLNMLYNAYVKANKLAESDVNIRERAREIFMKLEKGEVDGLENWNDYKQYTIQELDTVYKRLGVKFDVYNFESMYSARDIQNVIKLLETKKVIHLDSGGKKVAMIHNKPIPIIKSDGSMLYLTRDIAAALDRYNKYKFDQMLYIVDNTQSDHFNALHDVLFQMDLPWAGRIKHIKFGRIRGMSTRKGTAVFLKDILNEAQDIMKKNQIQSPTTKVAVTDDKTADILGISCVIINDLKQRRQKDYDFDWTKVLQSQGDTGVRLQYTHCRLNSLKKNVDISANFECNPLLLPEPEVIILTLHLAQFNDVLLKCQQQLEATALVVYLFRLCNLISKALTILRVKDQNAELASQRMLLFNVSKEILKQGMEILGIQPLNEM